MSLNKLNRNELLFTVFDACRCGYYDFIKHIFDANPSDINIINSLGQNCLMICCEFNSIEIFKYLISKKDINYLLSDPHDNWNCLHYALRYGNFRIAQMLLHNKISSIPYPKYQNDANGYNPFDLLPSNIYKKQLYDDIYTLSNKQIQREIYNSSYTSYLQKGWCQRVYGSDENEIISNLTVQGVLYAWGNNMHDQLGLNNNNKHRPTPKIITHLRNINIIDIGCSGYHSIGISETGNVYVWGNNIDGRCGIGHCNTEYKPYIKKPYMLKFNKQNNKNIIFTSCTAVFDHSTLLSDTGDIYVFGCDKSKSYLLDNKGPKLIVKDAKYNVKKKRKQGMKFIWTDKLEPFCVSNNNKCGMRYVSSVNERSVMIGTDNKLYMIGKSFNNTKLMYPTQIQTATRKLKKIGIQYACVGDNWLVILLMNQQLMSMSKNKDNSDEINFSEIRLNKEFRFRHHHNKRASVKIQYITCYNMDGSGRCIALATNNDIYEWKAPSTDAYYIGNINGITDISCGPKICIMTTNMGECYAFGDHQFLGISSKDKKLLKCNKKIKDNRHFKGYKRANIQRIISLTQIAKVYAFKNSVFVIQAFLWPNRNLLNATHHHQQLKQLKNKQFEKSFWNYDQNAASAQRNNQLFDTYNMFSVLETDEFKHFEEEEIKAQSPVPIPSKKKQKNKKRNKRKKSNKKSKPKQKQKRNSKTSKKSKPKQQVILPLMEDEKDEKDEKKEVKGLDEEYVCSKVPSLVSYCEDILIHQIDIQTVISLYKQSYAMGFHRISVFLSFVIIENINHLLYFFLRDCSQDEVMFVEHIWKKKYYPNVKISWQRYYGETGWLRNKKRIIEQYRILPKYYPNYKIELREVNDMLLKVDVIEEKVNKLVDELELEEKNNYESDEIIYFNSNDERTSDSDETDSDESDGKDKIFKFKNTLLNKALKQLTAEERNIYESKLQLLGERNFILFKIGNPEEFPTLQMMDKWKRQQKKINNYNTFNSKNNKNKKNNKSNKKYKNDKRLQGIGISDEFDADKYLKHVYLNNTYKINTKKLENKIGLSFTFDYEKYKKPKHKKQIKAIIYRQFNVRDAIEKDYKKAKKLDIKQEKIKNKKLQKQAQTNAKQNVSGKRRKRKRNQNPNQTLSPKSQPQNKNKNKIKNKNKNKSKINSPKNTNQRFSRQSPQVPANKILNNNSPNIVPLSPSAMQPQAQSQETISPIDVVRRNREKKLLEQQLSTLKNDVWDLTEVDVKNNEDVKDSSGSLSNILSAQKAEYNNERRQKKREQFVKYAETQNAWMTQVQKVEKNKGIRPQVKEDVIGQKKVVSVKQAQKEEVRLRTLAMNNEYEYEWMSGVQSGIGDKGGNDYDAFVKQQELLLKSFEEQSENVGGGGGDDGRRGGYNRGYGYGNGNRGRGRGGYRRDDRDDRYNDNYRGGYRGGYRGRGGRYDNYNYRGRGRGRGRGGYRYYNDNRQYNDSGDKWRRK